MKVKYKSDLGGLIASTLFFFLGAITWVHMYEITGKIFNFDELFLLAIGLTFLGIIMLIIPISFKKSKKTGKKK